MQDWWREVYRRFDPWRPADGAWRVERPRSPAVRIAAEIGTGVGPLRYVLLGTPGSGKSTELKALAERSRVNHLVVAHDVGTHFHETLRDDAALQRVRPWEVLFLLGLAVFRAGEETFHVHFPEALCERFEKAAARALLPGGSGGAPGPTLSVVKLAKRVAVLAGGAIGGPSAGKAIESLTAAGDAAEWNVPRQGRSDPDRPGRAGPGAARRGERPRPAPPEGEGPERADAATIDRAIHERRLVREEPWSARHDRVLKGVLNQRTLPDLSGEADGPEFLGQLVDSFQLLPYPNESLWLYPHPLLTLSRLPTG